MQITDDGVGIMDGAMHKPCSLGLLGLRERCVTLGGGLTVARGESAGTSVTVYVPNVVNESAHAA